MLFMRPSFNSSHGTTVRSNKIKSMTHKNVTVYAPNDGKPHLCRITVSGNKSHIEWLDESPSTTEGGTQGKLSVEMMKSLHTVISLDGAIKEEDKLTYLFASICEIHKDLMSSNTPSTVVSEDWDNFREQWLVGQVQSLRHSGFSETKASEIAVEQWNDLSKQFILIKKQ